MLNLAQAVREQIVKETPPRKGEARKSFTFAGLQRMALWGAMGGGAFLIAVLSARGDAGSQRLAAALHGGPAQTATRNFDAQAETRRLAEAVRGLTADGEQIKTRLASVEHDMNDVTGSVDREIAASNAARAVENGPSVSSTAATAALIPPAPPAPIVAGSAPATIPADAAVLATPRTQQYGVDIGSGLTIVALRARWASLRAAHPDLLAGLQPIVSVREVARANRVELRLVAGPFPQSAEAAQFCASLAAFGLFCQPTAYDGQRLALR
jgi:hypothetical protein